MLEIPIQERKAFKVELATATASKEEDAYKVDLEIKGLKSNQIFLLKNVVSVEKVARHNNPDRKEAIERQHFLSKRY